MEYLNESTDYSDNENHEDENMDIIDLIGSGAYDLFPTENQQSGGNQQSEDVVTTVGKKRVASEAVDLTDSQPLDYDLVLPPQKKSNVASSSSSANDVLPTAVATVNSNVNATVVAASSSSSSEGKLPLSPHDAQGLSVTVSAQVCGSLQDMTGKPLHLIRDIVNTYLSDHKEVGNVNSIIEDCFDQLLAIDDEDDYYVQLIQNPAVIASSGNNGSSSSSSSSAPKVTIPDIVEIAPTKAIKTPLARVLEVFPDAKQTGVQQLLEQYGQHVETVLQHMAEKGYEKGTSMNHMGAGGGGEPKQPALDFTSTAWETSENYREQALTCLQNEFPILSVDSVRTFFVSNSHHFTPTIDKIRKAIKVPDHELSTAAMNFTPAIIQELEKMGLKALKKKKQQKYVGVLDSVLAEELAWREKRSLSAMEKQDREVAEQLNVEIATEEGALIECGCCYNELPFDSFIQCSEGHLFCRDCLKHYVENTVFGEGRSAIKCMNSDPCDGFFPDSMLRNSLPEAVFAKFQDAVAKDAVKAAKINVCTCFYCQYPVEIEEGAGHIMRCPQCQKETCSMCGEESHVPLRCEEVEKKGQTNVRLNVEEAMTEARVRQCHRCKARFFKIEGCNKMTCSCGAKICYICRKNIDVEQYKHFCQTPNCDHKTCKKCKLFTDSIEDDRLAMLEAGKKTLEQQQREGGEDVAVTVNLDKLLEGGIKPAAKAQKAAQPPPPAAYAAHNAAFYAANAANAAHAFAAEQIRQLQHRAALLAARAAHAPPPPPPRPAGGELFYGYAPPPPPQQQDPHGYNPYYRGPQRGRRR